MGTRQSVYKRDNFDEYFKLTRTEHTLIKELWVRVESNPQFHGNAFFTGFCELYPHYVKFYTLDPRLPLHFDARSNAKFTMIMEALGYLLLDFFNKPKQLDRLVGYIAMSHKDMRLNKQDMFNFGYRLLDYLAQTFPSQMTAACQDAMTKYLTSILDELARKMDTFREYEMIHGIKPTRRLRLPFMWLTPCISNNLVFGQTMAYWGDRKREWDMRFDEWNARSTVVMEKVPKSSTEDDDTSVQKSKAGNESEMTAESSDSRRMSKLAPLQENVQATSFRDGTTKRPEFRHQASVITDNRFTGINPEKEGHTVAYKRKAQATLTSTPSESQRSSIRSFLGSSARQRYRAESLARDAFNPQSDPTVLRKRIRSSRMVVKPSSDQIVQLNADFTNDRRHPAQEVRRRYSNTARERRREEKRFSFELK